MTERITQEVVEVLRSGGTNSARVSQVAVEVLRSGGTNNARISQLCVEVLRENAALASASKAVVCICT